MIDSPENIHSFLDQKALIFNHTNFIETDPIQVPKTFYYKGKYRNCWVPCGDIGLGATTNYHPKFVEIGFAE